MSEEHFQRVAPLESRLLLAKMEIDDDDQDIILASIEVSNEASIPVGGLDIFIQTSDKKKIESNEAISSIGPGLTRSFTFEFPLAKGTWTFMIRSSSVEMDLGPFDDDFSYEISKGRVVKNSIGAGMFNSAFDADLDAFGNTEERGIIDSSEIKLTSYYGENAAGGSTAISVGNANEVEEQDDQPRTPPWQQKDPLLSAPIPDIIEVQPASEPDKLEEKTEQSYDILSFSKSLNTAGDIPSEEDSKNETLENSPITASTPPPLPINNTQTEDEMVESQQTSTTPSSPTSGPPTAPPSSPPSGPPSAPPSSPPSGPPSAPPSTPPSGPPSAPPSKPPSGPPSAPPSKPPSGPPSTKPSGPPTGPPSTKPSGSPTGPPSTKPSGPPSKKPSGPPKSKKPPRPPM